MAIYTPNSTLDDAVMQDNKLSTSSSIMSEFMQTICGEPSPPPISSEVKIDGRDGEITLEEYLNTCKEEILRVPCSLGGFEGNNLNEISVSINGNGNRSGRKRNSVDPTVDRAVTQRQKRMIKNRESAARSRERKQVYTGELEALVTQLEEENAKLMREKEKIHKQRMKQLAENLVPVTGQKKPPRLLRRTQSMQW